MTLTWAEKKSTEQQGLSPVLLKVSPCSRGVAGVAYQGQALGF